MIRRTTSLDSIVFPYSTLGSLTREVCSIVSIACTLVHRHLRVRTQRSRSIRPAVSDVCGRNLTWRLAALHPLVELAHHIERTGPVATGAVRHAWNHEQAQR